VEITPDPESQVHGRPQHMDYQPGNAWDNTRPVQPTEWSAWSNVGSGAPNPYNNYNSYNNYNPYSNYGTYIPGKSKQPYFVAYNLSVFGANHFAYKITSFLQMPRSAAGQIGQAARTTVEIQK